MAGWLKQVLQELRTFWKTFVVILTPLVFLPIPLIYRQTEVHCAYVITILAIFMMTECIPLGITSLLPVILFSMFGILPVSVLAACYMRSVHMLLIGSLMLAVAFEKSNLHKRIALKTLLVVGTTPRRLLMGVIVATGFLSMFVANVPTSAMMIPVVDAIINELRAHLQDASDAKNDSICIEDKNATPENDKIEEVQVAVEKSDDALEMEITSNASHPLMNKHYSNSENNKQSATLVDSPRGISNIQFDGIAKMLAIAICYSANVGGTATLTGTSPNLIAYDMWHDHYADHGLETPVSYAKWIPAALPGTLICQLIIWIWLQLFFLKSNCLKKVGNKETEESARQLIQAQYNQLGQLTFAEKSNIVFFVTLVLLWFLRKPGFMPGYGDLFPNKYIMDAVPALLIAVLLFIFPSEKPHILCFRKGGKAKTVPALLHWPTTYPKLAWTALFIMGAGFAISEACKASGLAAWLGYQLENLDGLSPWILSLLGSLLVSALTQVTSNTATVTLTQPILLALSDSIGVHPLRLAMPAVFACSSAFMLPASTAPNAMVYEKGHFTVLDMILCGFVLNIAFVLVNALGTETWMKMNV